MLERNVLRIALLSLMLCGCAVEDDRSAERHRIAPVLDDVRFFERPKLLSKLRNGSEPMPEIVFIERDPWKSVIGSDSPKFALYEDGRVIYRDGEEFRTIQLGTAELQRVRKQLTPAHRPEFKGGYRIVQATDQPDNILLFYRGDPVFLDVYGSLDDHEVASYLPDPIREAFETLRSFRHAKSKRWLPQWIEVMVSPYKHAVDPSIEWDHDWPGLSDQRTIRRGDSYSLFLPSTELEPLRQFLAKANPKGAIEIDGRKWSASIRFPFPQEQLWMAANPEA